MMLAVLRETGRFGLAVIFCLLGVAEEKETGSNTSVRVFLFIVSRFLVCECECMWLCVCECMCGCVCTIKNVSDVVHVYII